MLQVIRKHDTRVNRAWQHKLADIPGGLTIAAADMTQNVILEGQPVGIDSNGLGHIVKVAEVAADGSATTDTTYTVKKGHNFKVGDYVFAVKGGKSYAITTIATNGGDNTCDDITVGTALGITVASGDVLIQGAASGASAGAFKYQPIGMVGEAYDVEPNDNNAVNVVTFGQIKEAAMDLKVGSVVKGELKTILFM